MNHDENDLVIINQEEVGQRLDKILADRYKEIKSRTYFQYLIEEGKVLLNGLPIKKRAKPKEGDEVEIEFILTPELKLTPEAIPLDILYEDEYLLAVNKPAGMVVHPAVGHWSGTFANALLYHCKSLDFEDKTVRPGIVHRLDKETTGLLLAAKNTQTQQKLIELFSSRKVYKEYIALCLGNPGVGEVRTLIGRDLSDRKKMAVLKEGGKEALSRYKTINYNEKFSLVSIELATGRTHQIRVHMKHLGCPVLGDPLYGSDSANKKFKVKRQMLHAKNLRFEHPITGKKIELQAPLPSDMQDLVNVFF